MKRLRQRVKVLALTKEGYEDEVYLSREALEKESKIAYTTPTGKETVEVDTYRINLPSVQWLDKALEYKKQKENGKS